MDLLKKKKKNRSRNSEKRLLDVIPVYVWWSVIGQTVSTWTYN